MIKCPRSSKTKGKTFALKEDLQEAVGKILRERWSERDGEVVPEPEDLQLGNDGVNLAATVLYADITGSTNMVNSQNATHAAEFYKCYMTCAARIIKNAGGSVTAYDGDRVMGIFIGGFKNSTASKTALQINWALWKLVNPAIKNQYGNDAYQLEHVIGVDTSSILASRIGVRNDNDVVWVGRSANYAAKLTAITEPNTTFITGQVYDVLHESSKYGGTPKRLMWRQRRWSQMNDMRIFSSTWWWSL